MTELTPEILAVQNDRQFWTSGKNLRWVAFALVLTILHLLIEWRFPEFTPPAMGKPTWIRFGLGSELVADFIILGAGISGITNSIPSLRKPRYSQDGQLSLNPIQDFEHIRWGQLVTITLELAAFIALWLWLWKAI
jgi:hypothetical protein